MGKRLSEDQTARFEREGAVFPLRVLTREQAAGYRARLHEIEASRAGRLPPVLNAKAHLVIPFLWDIVHDGRILDPVEDILGPDLLCWGASFFAKRPTSADRVPWHQDATYWGLSAPQGVTVWLAFTKSVAANGCMRVVPGSHKRQLAHRDAGDPASMLPVGEEVDVAVDERRAVDIELQPGEMSMHHALLIHGSSANRSPDERVGFAIRYIPGHVSQRQGRRNFATLVRGRDHGTFDLEQPPTGVFDAEAMRRHRAVVRSFAAVVSGAKADAAAAAAAGAGAGAGAQDSDAET